MESAKELWFQLDANGKANAKLSYIENPAEVIKAHQRGLGEVLKGLAHNMTMVLWSVDQIDIPMKEFTRLVLSQQGRSISVRILNPDYLIDPDVAESRAVLTLMSAMQKPNGDQAAGASFYLDHKLSEETITALQKARYSGQSMRELAATFKVASSTAFKYTRDISPLKKESAKASKDRPWQAKFDFSRLDKLKIEKGSRLFAVVNEFIKSQRTFQTRMTYLADLQKFFRWAFEDKAISLTDPKEITFELGALYLDWLSSRHHKKTVIKRKFSTLNVLCNYCVGRSYLTSNPLATIKTPKVARHILETDILEASELNKVLSHAMILIGSQPSAERKLIAYRNFVGVFILATVGMRLGSLLSIRISDIKCVSGEMRLTMLAKGDDAYTVILDHKTAKVLDAYINGYFRDDPPESYLMCSALSRKSSPMTRAAFGMALKKIIRGAGIDEGGRKITAHSFRATFATQSYKAGRPLKEIQLKLNHKSIDQTSAYIKWADAPQEASWLGDLGEEFQNLIGVGG